MTWIYLFLGYVEELRSCYMLGKRLFLLFLSPVLLAVNPQDPKQQDPKQLKPTQSDERKP